MTMKYNNRMFSSRENQDGSITVILGDDFDDPESEIVIGGIAKDLLPQLIATLRLAHSS